MERFLPSSPRDPLAPGRRPHTGRRAWVPALLAAGIALAVVASLTWPLLVEPGSTIPRSPFGPSFAWSLRVVADGLGSGDLVLRTREAGWPWLREARFLGWVPMLVGVLLRPVLSPVATFNVLMLAAPPLGALACALWVRRLVPGVRPASLLVASVTYACSVHLLANVTNGELAKGWLFLVPLALVALDGASRSWRRVPLFGLAALAVVFTDPYALFCLGLAAPVLVARRPSRDEALRIAACAGVLLAVAGLGSLYHHVPGDPSNAIFSPSSAPMPARHCLGAPYASVPLLALVRPAWEDVPSGTHHGMYLGWTVLVLAAIGAVRAWRAGERRGVALGVALAGTGLLFSLGPWLFVTPSRPAWMPLPGMVLEWVMPERWGGMYYRFLHVALLGIALLVARVGLSGWWVVPLLAVFGLEVRWAAPMGWPVALETPPPSALVARMAADPVPGAVLFLPAYAVQKTVSTAAFTLAAFHDRPVTALPRHPRSPAEYAPAGMALDACVTGGPCAVPTTIEQDLERTGIRYLILRTRPPFQTDRLLELLEDRIGEPETAGDLAWWVLDPAPPEDVNARHPGPPPIPRKGPMPVGDGFEGRQPDGGYREDLGRESPPNDGRRPPRVAPRFAPR